MCGLRAAVCRGFLGLRAHDRKFQAMARCFCLRSQGRRESHEGGNLERDL